LVCDLLIIVSLNNKFSKSLISISVSWDNPLTLWINCSDSVNKQYNLGARNIAL